MLDQMIATADGQGQKLEDLARTLVAELQIQQPQGPYHLTGFCAHAVLAYEMAQQLAAGGEVVAHLALLDPSWPWSGVSSLMPRLKESISRLYEVGWQRGLSSAWRRFGKLIHPPTSNNPEKNALASDLPWERLDRLLAHYRPRPYSGHLSIITNESEIAKTSGACWRKLAQGKVDLRRIPAEHLTMFQGPSLILVTDQLRAWLSDDQGNGADHLVGSDGQIHV